MGLRVAFIILSNLSTGMGTENTVMQYCKYKPEGADVTIYQTDIPRGRLSEDKYDLGNSHPRIVTIRSGLYRLGFVNKFHFGYALFVFFLAPTYFYILRISPRFRKMRGELKNYDVIYICQPYLSSIVPKGPKVVAAEHNFEPKKQGLGKVVTWLVGYGLMWRRIDYYHLFSKGSWFLDRFGRRGFTIESGSRFQFPSERPRKGNDVIRFGYATRLEECKGILRVVEAFSILKRAHSAKDVELHIYGEGLLRDRIEKDEGLFIHGWVEDEKMPQILSSIDCFVYPTTCDNFSLAVVEALAAGSYVITSDVLMGVFDGFERIGVLSYCPLDPLSLAKCMERFIDSNIPEEVFKKSRELILQDYTWESISKKLFTEFYKMVEKRNQT